SRSRAESALRVASPKAFPPEKPDLRIERVADGQMLDVHPVPIGGVGELRHIARVVAPASGRPASRVVAVERHVLEDGESRIDAENLVGIVSGEKGRPLRADESNGAAPKDVAPHAHDGKVRRRGTRTLRCLGLYV